MLHGRALAAVLSAVLLPCCGAESAPPGGPGTTTAPSCLAGELLLSDGSCLASGVQENGCGAGELADASGACRPAGIPADLCAEGFDSDGSSGCRAILPAEICPEGTMAVPGETACREVAPCAAGTWGDIPTDVTTEHVDGTYAGADGDGSPAKPWRTVQEAVDAAESGAIVAIAAGTYVGDVRIESRPVRLWGRCPSLVEVSGTGAELGAVFIGEGASATEVRDLAIGGTMAGVALSGSTEVLLHRVWVHETGSRGIAVQDDLGPTSLTVRGSLVERAGGLGAFVAGAEVVFEASIVRETRPVGGSGRGITSRASSDGASRAKLGIASCVIEGNEDAAVVVAGSEASIVASVLRDTRVSSDHPEAAALETMRDWNEPADVLLSGSVLERNAGVGVSVEGSHMVVRETTIRDGEISYEGRFGWGATAQDDLAGGERASFELLSSVIANHFGAGVNVLGSDALVESTVIADTSLGAAQHVATGLAAHVDPATGARASVTIRGSVVERSSGAAILVSGSDATIESTLVRDTLPSLDGRFGRGITIQLELETLSRSAATVFRSVVEQSRDVGIFVGGSDALLEGTLVRGTEPQVGEGTFGDGIAVIASRAPASAAVTLCRIDSSARAGVSSFGASIALGSSALECAGIDLDGEPYEGAGPEFDDLGGNVCGCEGMTEACRLESTALAPPEVTALPD